MRKLLPAALVIASTLPADAQESRFSGSVYLNAAGAMERLCASSAEHCRIVQEVLAGLDQQHLEVYDSRRASGHAPSLLLLTTWPPQRDVTFAIDETRYRVRLTLDPAGVKVLVARN